MSGNNVSLQERLAEELALLPGRISRYFFLVATLDAQASQMRDDLQLSRQRALMNCMSSSAAMSGAATYLPVHEPQKQTSSIPEDCPLSCNDHTSPASKQFDAIQKLHNAQRQLLADKLYVERKAAEWFKTARRVVLRYHAETQNTKRGWEGSRPHSPRLKTGLSASVLSEVSDPPGTAGSHGSSRRVSNGRQSQEHYVTYEGSYETSSTVTVPKKRRLTTGGYERLYQQRHRRQEGESSLGGTAGGSFALTARTAPSPSLVTHSRRSGTSSVVSEPVARGHAHQRPAACKSYSVAPGAPAEPSHSGSVGASLPAQSGQHGKPREGVIIKLGSQKGRPRKASSKQSVERMSGAHEEHVPAVSLGGDFSQIANGLGPGGIVEEYICPICGKSENENPAMVACDNCDKWYHCVCVGFLDEADAASKAFYCPSCQGGVLAADSDGF